MSRSCEECGNDTVINETFCASCGYRRSTMSNAGRTATATATTTATQRVPLLERVHFDQAGITVSTSRFMVQGETQTMRDVISARKAVVEPSRFGPGLTVLMGLFALGIGSMHPGADMGTFLGSLMVGVGIVWLQSKKPTYDVRLASAHGERTAYSSRDRAIVERIVRAINEAIARRS